MPSIARRGASRRRPSSVQIEDDDPSQRSRAEDVDDDNEDQDEEEEVRPRRSKKATKAQKKSKSSRRAREPSAEAEEDDAQIEAPPIDVENFQNQPLTKAEGAKVGAMANDWDTVIKKIQDSALSLVTDVATAMAEAGLGHDQEPAIKELIQIDIVMRELLDTQAELKAHQTTLNDIWQSVARGDAVNDAVDRYGEGVHAKVESWKQKTSRQKYAKDEDYTTFKQRIFEVQHPDEPMPPMTELIDAEDGDDSDDDDIQVGGVTQDYKCPLSLTTLVNPVTSQVCQHSFSAAAIQEYLGSNRSVKKKCPASGCSKVFGWADLQSNKGLEKRAKAYARREQRKEAEANSDADGAEEVID